MRTYSDTSPEAQRALSSAYRALSPARKMQLLGQEFRFARSLHERGFRLRNPGAGEAEIRESWNAMRLGPSLWDAIKARGVAMDHALEPEDVLREVAAAFVKIGVPYAVGGSFASSLYGEIRSTRDADISVEPFAGKERDLAACLGNDYFLSVDASKEAIRLQSTFNIIHNPTAFKVDVFIIKAVGFERSLMARRSPSPGRQEPPLVFVSAEDIVLLKLRWYRLGNETSERQWLDVLGVLRTQADDLDSDYLNHWAGELGVRDLLDEARTA